MSRIIIIKGDEFTAPTALSGANSVNQATLVKLHTTSATTVTLVDSANTAIGNTTVSSGCLLYTSPSPRDQRGSRMPSSA